jgi:carbamoyl-phosphate synthase large subunit
VPSRTVPFVSKATGVSWARIAAKVMAGCKLADLEIAENYLPDHTSVKESVFPFSKFPGVDVILGPEMRSPARCMGADDRLGRSRLPRARCQPASRILPTDGNVFLSVRDSGQIACGGLGAAAQWRWALVIYSTGGTYASTWQRQRRSTVNRPANKISEGGRPNALDKIKNGELAS